MRGGSSREPDRLPLDGQLTAPPHKTLAQWAVAQLREMILSGQLPAGERLYEADLAARMSISRTPVREAIRQLEQEGLVTVYPNRETIVTAFTADDVREIYQLRAAVEGMAARVAAEQANGAARAVITDILDGMQRQLESGNQAAYLELDVAFHDAVVRASGNSRLVETRLRMRDQMRRYLTFTLGRVSDEGMQRNFRQHEGIAHAIFDQKADLAEELMRAHVSWTGDRIAHDLADTESADEKGVA